MSAKLHKFQPRQKRINSDQAVKLEQLLIQFSADQKVEFDALNKILAAVQRSQESNEKWTFVMLSPQQNSDVLSYLIDHSKRPQQAAKLWGLLFTAMRTDTGEICATRDELAEALNTKPNHVSRIMSELAAINAIIRKKEGRRMRYFMNPMVGTCLTGPQRDAAQEEAGQLSIFDVIEGGKAS